MRFLKLFIIFGFFGFLMSQQDTSQQQPQSQPQQQPAPQQQASQGAGTEQEEEVTEKAEYSIDDAVKPITDVTLAPFEPIDSLLYRKERKLELRLPKTIEDEIRKVIKLENLFIRQPVYPITVERQVALDMTDFIKKYKNVRDWKVEIYDSWGNKLREYSGKGKPPQYVIWDGKDEKGKAVMAPGELFQFRFIASDGKETRRELSKPFTRNGYYYEEGGYKNIIVSMEGVFEKGFAVFREGQEDRIIEALNIVKENYPWTSPIEITYYPSPEAMGVMEERIRILKQFILSRLPIEEGNLVLKPGYYEGGGIKIEKMVVKFK
jgi:hypothetical protein